MADRMKEYHVTWAIEVDGNSPEDAARAALAIQRDPESTAVVFDVTDPPSIDGGVDGGLMGRCTTVRVDLGPWPPKVTKLDVP